MTIIAHPELEGLDRYKFGWADSDVAGAAARRGLSEEVVRDISAKKNEPEWMLDLRLKGLRLFRRKPMPTWGSDLSRGMTEDEAAATIVRGFVEPIARELPMEYALELNRLIELQMEGAVG
jgi:hypothetical protein